MENRKGILKDYYELDILLNYHYYPFGMQMPERYNTADGYRYGFQGQEKDNELKGEGNSLNYEYRMHDPRIGRFFAVDPLAGKYPYNSPYAFSENVVINAVELEGLEKVEVCTENGSYNYESFEEALDPEKNANYFETVIAVKAAQASFNSAVEKGTINGNQDLAETSVSIYDECFGNRYSATFYGEEENPVDLLSFDYADESPRFFSDPIGWGFGAGTGQAWDHWVRKPENGMRLALGVGLFWTGGFATGNFLLPSFSRSSLAFGAGQGGADFLFQWAMTGDINKVNISSSASNLVWSNAFFSSAMGSGFEFSINDGFSKSFFFGDKSFKRFAFETAVGTYFNWTTSAVSKGLKTELKLAGNSWTNFGLGFGVGAAPAALSNGISGAFSKLGF